MYYSDENTIRITKEKIYKYKEENINCGILENVEFIDETIFNSERNLVFSAYYNHKIEYGKKSYEYNMERVNPKIDLEIGCIYNLEWKEKNKYYCEWKEDEDNVIIHKIKAIFVGCEIVQKNEKYYYTLYNFKEVEISPEEIEKENYNTIMETLISQNKELKKEISDILERVSAIYNHIGVGNNSKNDWDY